MIAGLLARLFASQLSRWVTVGVVTALLGGAAYWWYDFKRDLRHEGAEECIQAVNEETHKAVVENLYRQQQRVLELQSQLSDLRVEKELALERERRAKEKLMLYKNSVRAQLENDEKYREWSRTELPNGVAERMRELAKNN